MKNGTQGFTLIELLIVIAIIGILAAVLIPNLLSARTKANESAAQTYLRNTVTALETNRDTVSGKLTDGGWGTAADASATQNANPTLLASGATQSCAAAQGKKDADRPAGVKATGCTITIGTADNYTIALEMDSGKKFNYNGTSIVKGS